MKYRTTNSEGTIAGYDPILQESFYVEGTAVNGAINVNADISGSGTLDSNITQIGGANITLGQKTMANSLPVTIASDQTPIDTMEQTGLVPFVYDYIEGDYPNSTTDEYTFKSGGSGGTTVATVTIVYTDSSKENIDTVTRT